MASKKKKTKAAARAERRPAAASNTEPASSGRRSFEFGALYRLAQILLAAFLLYVTASLFAIGAGVLGSDIASCILRIFGGAFVLILLHFFYGLLCSLLNRQVHSVLSQWLGTFSLYGAVSLFLGMLKKAGIGTEVGLLSPGIFGTVTSVIMPRFIGIVGTMLIGLCLVFLAAFNYGHLSAARVERVREIFGRIKLPSLPRISFPRITLPSFKLPSLHFPSFSFRRCDEETEQTQEEIIEAASDSQEQETEEEVQTPVTEQEEAEEEETQPLETEEPEEQPLETEEPEEETPEEGTSETGIIGRLEEAIETFLYMLGFGEGKHGSKSNERTEDGAEVLVSQQHPDTDNPVHTEVDKVVLHVQEGEENVEDGWEKSSPLLPPPDPKEFQRDERVQLVESSRRSQNSTDGVQDVRSVKKDVGHAEAAELPVQVSPVTSKPVVEIDTSSDLAGTEVPEATHERTIPAGSFPPPLDLLGPHQEIREAVDDQEARESGQAVIESLGNFGVSAELKRTIIGPTVVQYQLQLAPGIKVSKVSSLGNDIAVALGVPSIRVEAPIPGTSYIGIELPNVNRRAVPLRQIIESSVFQNTRLKLPLPLGQTVDGRILIAGLEELPHLLIAGTTGSGKSIFVNNCIVAMCYHNTPQELRFIMVDPKRVEMGIYEYLPHILAKPIVTASSAVHALGWAVREMERRYDVCSQAKVRNISSYNEKVLPKDRLPHIVIVVDELADLMMTAQKEVEDYIMRLAQMARAIGIHLMLATQRPSVNVLTGTIKANIPARVSFSLPTIVDSRTIIDRPGAQNLLGKGDMLFVSTRSPHPMRIQSPFIDEQTNIRIVDYLRSTFGDPEYIDLEDQENGSASSTASSFVEDDRLEEAIEIVLNTGIASTSGLQRRMKVGFTRAGNMIDTMEMLGIIGPKNGAKPREILVDEAEAWEILQQRRNG